MKIYLTIDVGLYDDDNFVRFHICRISKFSFDVNIFRGLLFINDSGKIRLDTSDRYVLTKNFRRYCRALGG